MNVKPIHSGQYKRYGDSYYVWEIETNGESREEVLQYIRENVFETDLPPADEWAANVRFGGAKFNDAAYYFRGCYTLELTDNGYRFTVIIPYCD